MIFGKRSTTRHDATCDGQGHAQRLGRHVLGLFQRGADPLKLVDASLRHAELPRAANFHRSQQVLAASVDGSHDVNGGHELVERVVDVDDTLRGVVRVALGVRG